MDQDQPSVFDQMAAALNDHQVTDENGELNTEAEEATTENPAAQEEITSEEETPTAEKPAKSEQAPSQEAVAEDENELGVDDSGKRYVPEARLKKETQRFRETERKLKALEAQLQQGNALLQSSKNLKAPLPEPENTIDKADILELKLTKPQFNDQSPDYNRELDELAYKIFKAEPGTSIMEAANKAEEYAKAIASRISGSRAEARQVKSLQADQGMTSRGGQRSEMSVDPQNMSLEEMETYLKANGGW